MSLDYARYRLQEWGQYGREKSLSYPKQWAVASNGFGGADPLTDAPTHVAEVEVIVRQMEPQPRAYLIVHYCQTGSGREKALRMGVPRTTYFRWVNAGEWHVHIELEYSEFSYLQPGTKSATFAIP